MIAAVAFLVNHFPFQDIHELYALMKYQRKFFGLFSQRDQVGFKLDIGVECVAQQLILMPDTVVVPLYGQPPTGFDKGGFMALPYILEQVGQ